MTGKPPNGQQQISVYKIEEGEVLNDIAQSILKGGYKEQGLKNSIVESYIRNDRNSSFGSRGELF